MYLTLDYSDDKLYAYLREETYQRGLNFKEASDDISFTLHYSDEDRQTIAKTYNIKRTDIEDGVFLIKL
ncbi:hypothetical protein [Belliella aquatica]|uniref:Uncharacterized protein n=1 Tax=Belliella aquatica TaxID=1323734 RepID=A0ABQ1LXC5_9BACT|nr:hypothetical protein [Belliella aquatica]MCH7405719.1 hypothetical protein [Belliella aquatica]GGC31276.1 hypothetical protein GCM10010993_07740 [Belliella aquatica]